MEKRKLEIWKTIELGTPGLRTAKDLQKAIINCRMGIEEATDYIFSKLVIGDQTEVDLVKVSVAMLGFERCAMRKKIYARARELNLRPCPPEVGPKLRLQYKDQPKGEVLLIGMKPVRGLDNGLFVFCVENISYPLLRIEFGDAARIWYPCVECVFVRPRVTSL